MKKTNFAIAALAAMFSILFSVPAASAASFPDVPENSINYNAVEYLKTKGVVSGYPDGSFQPDKTINRAEALKMGLLATGTKTDATVALSFPDVTTSDWFYDYVRKGFEKGIVKGYDDGTFKPGNDINVAESLKVILLAFGAPVPEAPADNPYPDVEKGSWYAAYAQYCKTRQLFWPQDDGKLHAERKITRGEYARLIYRFMYTKENNLEKFPLSTDWRTFTHPTEHYLLKYPYGWEEVVAGNQTVFWKKDVDNGQISFGRLFPNSAIVVAVKDPNENRLTFDEYLNGLKYYTTGITQRLTLNNYAFASISIEATGSFDYYFEMPDKSILVLYTNAGDGLNRSQLLEEIRNLVATVRYIESTTGTTGRDEFLSGVREKILLEGEGQAALDMFKEMILLETDTIGIGTGPIDYYYSADYDVTLKMERNSKTLLSISDGKTSAF